MKQLLVLLATLFCLQSSAQNIAAFSDRRGYFYVFDNGIIKQLEYLPIQSFKMGRNYLAYVDNQETFKVYYKGKTEVLSENRIGEYYPSDYLMVYGYGKSYNLFYDGKVIKFSHFGGKPMWSDSIAIVTENQTTYIFYKDTLLEYEDWEIRRPHIGKNILTYIDPDGYFIALNNNKPINLESYELRKIAIGANVIAFLDDADIFKVFYKDDIYELDTYTPQFTFRVGDDMVAYKNMQDDFRVFYKGEIHELGTTISTFEIKDYLLIFRELSQTFNVFYDKRTYFLEAYIPSDYKVDFHTLAYKDINGWLKAFYKGKLYDIANGVVDEYDVYGDVIIYNTNPSEVKIWHKGNTYSHLR